MVRRKFRQFVITLCLACAGLCAPCDAALDETPARLEALANGKTVDSEAAPASDNYEPANETIQPIPTPATVTQPIQDEPEPQQVEVPALTKGALISDSAFLSARKAYQSKHPEALEALAEQTKGHPLDGYVQLWRILLKLRAAPDDPAVTAAMRNFIARHENEYLGERARGDWARIAGDADDYVTFDKLWRKLSWQASEPDLRCLRAYVNVKKNASKSDIADAQKLLTEPFAVQFDACKRLSYAVVEADPQWGWQQLFLWVQQSRFRDARSLLARRPAVSLPFDARTALSIINTPKAWYKSYKKRLHRISPLLLSLASLRFSNVDRDIAATIARAASKRVNAQMKAVLWGRLGHLAVLDFDPKALSYFQSAGHLLGKGPYTAHADDILQWNVRANLRANRWSGTLSAINALPSSLARLPDWQYWKARALQATNHPKAARDIWSKLRHLPEFYGLLSADALGVPYTLGSDQLMQKLPRERFARFEQNPHLNRAIRFYAVDLNYEGNREWNWSMRGMQRNERLELAQYAHELGIAHRSITTCESTGKVYRELMFPLAHEEQIRTAARASELPADWLFGLIRQESRFIATAKSSVGALGLMQVMPRTARWVAKKVALRDYRNEHLTRLETNLLIGAYYLKFVSESFNQSIVLSTASYNAGPNRAQAWNAALTRPLEGAIFAETIPFRETRDYVKRVTANMVHYSAYDLPTPRSLTDILGRITPSGQKRIALP